MTTPAEPEPPRSSVSHIDAAAAVGSLAPRQVEIGISNPGTFDLSWAIEAVGASPWLALDRTEGVGAGSITPSLRPDGLEVGMHQDTLVLSRQDRPETRVLIPVAFDIMPCSVTDLGHEAVVTSSLTDSDCTTPNRTDHFAKLFRVGGGSPDSVSIFLSSQGFEGHIVIASEATVLGESSSCGARRVRRAFNLCRLPTSRTFQSK